MLKKEIKAWKWNGSIETKHGGLRQNNAGVYKVYRRFTAWKSNELLRNKTNLMHGSKIDGLIKLFLNC